MVLPLKEYRDIIYRDRCKAPFSQLVQIDSHYYNYDGCEGLLVPYANI